MERPLQPALFRFVSDMHGIGQVLLSDLALAKDRFAELAPTATASEASREEAVFWTKTIIRCFMGLVDGVSYVMRSVVVKHARDTNLTLSNKEIALLRAKKYDKRRDRVLSNEPVHLATADSFKLAFRYFPRLFGMDVDLDTGGEPWRGFKRLVKVRNNFTHPKIAEHLAVFNALPALWPTVVWVTATYHDLLQEVGQRIGGSFTDEPGPAFRAKDAPWTTIFSEEDMNIVRSCPGRPLSYVGQMFRILHNETRLAGDLAKGASGNRHQFAYRTYARTVCSEFEGIISACRFFLEAGAERGEAKLSDSDRAALNTGEVEDKLVAVANLWSREYGTGHTVPRLGKGWKELRGTRFFRNRITHPKSQDALTVNSHTAETIMKGNLFLIEIHKALTLDIEKWVRIGDQLVDDAIEAATGAASEDEEPVGG